MKTFFVCVTIAIFAVACSGDKEGSAKGAPTAEDIKKDPLKAADKIAEAACACKDEACISKLKENKDLETAIKEHAAKGPKEAKEVAEKMEAVGKKFEKCLADLKK